MAAPDRRAEDRPPRWGYAAAIIVSAAAHAGIALFLLFVLPGLWRQEVMPAAEPIPSKSSIIFRRAISARACRGSMTSGSRRTKSRRRPKKPHEEPKAARSEGQAAPTAPPVENDKNAIALNSTPVPSANSNANADAASSHAGPDRHARAGGRRRQSRRRHRQPRNRHRSRP